MGRDPLKNERVKSLKTQTQTQTQFRIQVPGAHYYAQTTLPDLGRHWRLER